MAAGPTRARRQQTDQRFVIESAHPYEAGESHVWSVVMEGAKTIEVSSRCLALRVPIAQQCIALVRHGFHGENTETPINGVPVL